MNTIPSAQPTEVPTAQSNTPTDTPTDLISRQAAIDEIRKCRFVVDAIEKIKALPPAQPEIIRCNACSHWHQTTGKMKGFGLGDCDYLEKKLVTCNGYCYWAERKEEE